MPTTKAQAAKDKGNDAFKNGDYPSAIGYYTQAILEDSKDWTFPLNRAAAYLKLGKNDDAERDCNTVLTLNTTNVKALFRRAQARRALEKLDEAQKDLEQAIALDPSNQSVKTELSVVKDQLWKKSASEVVHPMRRRVPIKIIEPSLKESSAEGKRASTVKTGSKPSNLTTSTSPTASNNTPSNSVAPQSTKSSTIASISANTASTVPDSPNPPPQDSAKPKSSSFQEAKRARNDKESNTTRVGGGIFRASGKNTIFTPRSSTNNENNSPSGNNSGAQAGRDNPAPTWGRDVRLGTDTTTLFEFAKGWSRLSDSSIEERFRYIMAINPSSYPNMIQYSLEPSLLTGMFKTLREALDELRVSSSPSSSSPSPSSSDPHSSGYSNITSLIASVLRAYLKVRRIRTVVMFLSPVEREMMKGVVEEVLRTTIFEARGIAVEKEKEKEDVAEDGKAREAWMSMLR
ncbi:hypothetical protein DFH05DRAFT_1255114 [Lentinula detonsa]|uniref:RNA polymerase II-associated protein 3 n=1 Tax=Lentinula detonsa TaxID=2804962 RepID=A0A9W8NXK2_9AGAR|nr:hypothetical protein DFH05DRAFT_1255114 [Lentinula detonsa]